jgi:hypothetical protein
MDWAGYPTGKPSTPAGGFRGIIDFTGLAAGNPPVVDPPVVEGNCLDSLNEATFGMLGSPAGQPLAMSTYGMLCIGDVPVDVVIVPRPIYSGGGGDKGDKLHIPGASSLLKKIIIEDDIILMKMITAFLERQ